MSTPSEQSVKTFCEWYKKNRKLVFSKRHTPDESLVCLIHEVDDFIRDYGPEGN